MISTRGNSPLKTQRKRGCMSITIPLVPFVPAVRAHVHPADIIADIGPKDIGHANVLFINMPLRESARPNTTPEGPLLLATRLLKQYQVHKTTIVDLNA